VSVRASLGSVAES